MKQDEYIIQTEKKIRELNRRISILKEKNALIKFLFLKRLERQVLQLEAKQFNNIDKYLVLSSPAYQMIVNENLALLQKQDIEFIVYQYDYLLYGTYTSKMEGQIHANGCSYSNAVGSNFEILPFDSLKYSSELKGQMDHWGKVNLKTTKTKMALFKSLPKKFKGHIDAQGQIHLTNIENEWDIVSGGKFAISKLIASHFIDDEIKKEKFFDNKQRLKELIFEYRERLQGEE